MKVLVVGAGVIGGEIAHALCKAGNEVHVIARNAWKETLEKNGLRIYHYLQKKETVDHPFLHERAEDLFYDLAFAVMQTQQMEAIAEDLAALHCPLLVLVGNNLSASLMEERILASSKTPKSILFGFGSIAGKRSDGIITAVHMGDGKLTIGRAECEAKDSEKALVKQAFSGSRMAVEFTDNMDAWLKYHAAFILPVVYLSYAKNCDLRRSTREERTLLLAAVKNAYHLLMELGVPVRPVNDEKTLEPGLSNLLVKLVICLFSLTKIGALCTSEHCRHAPEEMEALDAAFHKLRALKPETAMPQFEELDGRMPSWEVIRKTYGKSHA